MTEQQREIEQSLMDACRGYDEGDVFVVLNRLVALLAVELGTIKSISQHYREMANEWDNQFGTRH